MFVQGVTYKAILNGQARMFVVLDDLIWRISDGQEYWIEWDDGDKEWAYELDMKRWTDDYTEQAYVSK